MTSLLNQQIVQILVQTTPKMEGMINRFEKKLFSGRNGSRKELVAIMAEGIAYCAEHFRAGVGIENTNELARWATTWNECSILLGNYMCSCPSLLIESGLVNDCLEMTRGRDYFFEPVLSFVDEKKHKTLEKLFAAGYAPLLDDHRLGLLCSIKDVSKCPRDLLEPFVLEGLKKIAQLKNSHRSGDQIAALVGRYLGCAEPAADNLAAFEKKIWPRVLDLFPSERADAMASFVQHGIAGYPSAKTLGISRLIMADCLENPLLLSQLINGESHHSHVGKSYNPFETSDIKYSKLPPKFFDQNYYFQSILDGRIKEQVLYGTFPGVVKSGFDYSKHEGYLQLQKMAERSMLEIVSCEPHTSLIAALILKLTPIEHIMEAFPGPEGAVAHLMFQVAWNPLSSACELPPISMDEVATKIAQSPMEDIIRYREVLGKMSERKHLQASELETLDIVMLGEFRELDRARRYLESLDIDNMKTMRRYCAIVAENSHVGDTGKDRFARQVRWKNEELRDALFGGDLGL